MRQTWTYTHPELERPWNTNATSRDAAWQKFEDCWALRVQSGLLEKVDGSFFDGRIGLHDGDLYNDLCPNDLAGHMWVRDFRPCRQENVPTCYEGPITPVMCVLCEHLGWWEQR